MTFRNSRRTRELVLPRPTVMFTATRPTTGKYAGPVPRLQLQIAVALCRPSAQGVLGVRMARLQLQIAVALCRPPAQGGLGVRMARLQFQIAVALCRPSAQGGGVELHINTQMRPITVNKGLGECRTGCECCRFSITFQMMQAPLLGTPLWVP